MLKSIKKDKDDKKEIPQEELIQQRKEKTAQQWIPIVDIDRNIVYRKDGHIFGMLRIQPINLELLSLNEKRRKIEALTEGFNGETEDFQIFCVGRPVDLNNYLEWLQDKTRAEQDFTRKMLLKGYMQHASLMASSGDTKERRFYLIVSKKDENNAESELLQRLNDFQGNLSQAELESHICDDDQLLDVFSLFANPIHASFERTEIQYAFSTLLDY